MEPIEKLRRQSEVARYSSQSQKAKHYKQSNDINATIIGYNADIGANVIQLPDGSISYARSDTNGATAKGDSVPLHGGTNRIDGLPYIKKQPIVAKKTIPKITYPVKVLFSVYNQEISTYEVYIGGDRDTPDLIYSTNNPIQIGRITNTGTNKDDWIVSIRIRSDNFVNNTLFFQSVIITSTNSYVFDDLSVFPRDLSQFCGAGFIANKLEINTNAFNERYNSDRIRRGMLDVSPSRPWYYRKQVSGVINNNVGVITSETIEDPEGVSRRQLSQTFPQEYSSLETGNATLTTPYPFSGTGSRSFSESTESELNDMLLPTSTAFRSQSRRTKTQNNFSFGIYKEILSGNWVERQSSGIYTDNSSGSSSGTSTFTRNRQGEVIDQTYEGSGNSNNTITSTYKQFVFPNLLKDAYFQSVSSSTNTIIRRLFTDILLSTDMSQTLALKAQIDYDFELINDGAENIIEDRSIYTCVTIDSTGTESLIPVIPEFTFEFPTSPSGYSNNLAMANYIKAKNKVTYINHFNDLFYERFYECVNKNITYEIMEFTINNTGMTFKNKKVKIKSFKKPDINASILNASVF